MNTTYFKYLLLPAALLSTVSFAQELDEEDAAQKVNVAFRSVPQEDLLGGVSVLDYEELAAKNNNTYSLDNMQGYVSGFNGASLWGQTDYLVLVDGVPRDADNVKPDEIAQVTFMKGAQAVVLYGSRAAKGVILITTKRGKSFINGLAVALQMIYPGIAQMEGQGINLDHKALLNELKKSFKSTDSVSMEKLQGMQMNLQGMMERATKAKGAKNDKEGKKYLEEQVKKDKGFKKTASGIAYKVLKQGAGENFNDSATVDVTYVGKHIDGKEFDNSQGKPVPFNLKMTVPGFREIISNMKPGEKVIAIIPGALAYGEQGNPQGGIGPNETLVFEITTVGVHKEDPAAMSAMPGRPTPAPAPAPAPAPKAKK